MEHLILNWNYFLKPFKKLFKNVNKESYLVLFGMLYATIFFCSFIMGYKTIDLYGRILCSSVLIFPLLFPLNDSITELFDAKISYNMIIAIIICEFLFSIITYGLARLPSPTGWQAQEMYPILTSGFIHIAIADSISLSIGFIANTYVLSKWGIKLFGKSFFLRSFGCTAIGELLFTISTNFITFNFLSTANIADTLNIIVSDYFIKVAYSFLICIPNAFIVNKLRKIMENSNISVLPTNVIPFNTIKARYRT